MITLQEEWEKLGIEESCSIPETEAWIFQMVLNHYLPNNILEIGFYRGGSAWMMMRILQDAKLVSVDPIYNDTDKLNNRVPAHKKEWAAVDKIEIEFGDRFHFINKRSQDVRPDLEDFNFDFMYIDGDHWEDGARNDLQLMLDLDIPVALIDDFIQPQNCPKSIPTVFHEEFSDKLKIKALFAREASCQGQPITMALVEKL